MNGLERSEVPEWPLTFTHNRAAFFYFASHAESLKRMLDTYRKIGYKLFIVFAVVAQSVEQRTENPCVDSSILSDGIDSFIKLHYFYNLQRNG